jgi:peptide/nickel transport system substrate-binding protein
VTGPGKQSHCETVITDCDAVYNYLSSKAATPSTWKSFGGGLWDVVDGPWQLVSANNFDDITLRYNSHYSGHQAAHHISTFELVPFQTEEAEFNVLEDPQIGQKVDVGYLPTVDAPVSLTGYKLAVVYPWMLSYFPYNFNNPTVGPIFSQQYFREAFQLLVDQEGVVNGPMHGYGKATIGPVADYPSTIYLSPQLQQRGDQWTLNPARAETLLRGHGWSIKSGGTDTCISPGTGSSNCGPHIKLGAKLSFTLDYASGIDYMESQVKELVSNASLVGIKIKEDSEQASTVIDEVFANTGPWELAEWGSWTYSPDYLPTGEELFGGASGNNGGHYNSSTNNALITKTLTAKTPAQFYPALYTWENWLAADLPVVYTPNAATLVESVNNLVIGPQSPTLLLTPEDWYYLK